MDELIFLTTNFTGTKLKLVRFSGDFCGIIFSCSSDKQERMAEYLADNFTTQVDEDSICTDDPCRRCSATKCFKQTGYQPIIQDDFLSIIDMVKLAVGEEIAETYEEYN